MRQRQPVFFLALICFFLLITTSPLVAAHVIGNGGYGVDCPGIKKIRLLDYYEGEVLRGLVPDLGASKDPFTKVNVVLNRIKDTNQDKYQSYSQILQLFQRKSVFLPGVVLTDTNDAPVIELPRDCHLLQIAVQHLPEFSEDPIFIISKDAWDLMNSDDQAGLILHEIIYYDALRHGDTTSSNARYLTSFMSSGQWRKLTPAVFTAFLKERGLDYVRWHDGVKNRNYILLDRGFRTFEEAESACRGVDSKEYEPLGSLIDSEFLNRIRASFLGKFFISSQKPLYTWFRHAPDLDDDVLAISWASETQFIAEAGESYSVLCQML